jgi:thiol-disulfide isomerase/thioredoxin
MVLGQGNIPLLSRYFMTVFVCCMVASASRGQSNSMALSYAAVAKAAPPTPIKPLTVGDKVPDIEIENIINFPTTKARLSDFKNKVVIIDFWGTTCTSCILALPKIDSLQKIFRENLQVLTVTNYDTKDKVEKTLQRYKKTKNSSLPVVLNNDLLKQYFPHEIISHVVWIDGNGIVKAITGTEYVTAINIQKVVAGEDISWPVKKDVFRFDYDKPFVDFAQQTDRPAPFYSSALTGHMEGVDATDRLLIDSNKQTITENHFNYTLLQLCDRVVQQQIPYYFLTSKVVVLQVKDPGRYIRADEFLATWEKKNTYCYSITLPLTIPEKERQQLVTKDIAHWLNVLQIDVNIEKRTVHCLKLINLQKDIALLQSKGGQSENSFDEDGAIKKLKNGSFSSLTEYFNYNVQGIPWVLDETNIPKSSKIDLELHLRSFQDIPALRKELQRYGLDLIEAQAEMDVCIISEK